MKVNIISYTDALFDYPDVIKLTYWYSIVLIFSFMHSSVLFLDTKTITTTTIIIIIIIIITRLNFSHVYLGAV
jgi:hypothetical protein